MGFSVVGIAALLLSAIEFAAVTVLAPAEGWAPWVQTVAAGQLLLLSVVWAAANSVAARRS